MPDDIQDKQPVVDAKTLFLAARFSKEAPADSQMKTRAVIELRAYSRATG